MNMRMRLISYSQDSFPSASKTSRHAIPLSSTFHLNPETQPFAAQWQRALSCNQHRRIERRVRRSSAILPVSPHLRSDRRTSVARRRFAHFRSCYRSVPTALSPHPVNSKSCCNAATQFSSGNVKCMDERSRQSALCRLASHESVRTVRGNMQL